MRQKIIIGLSVALLLTAVFLIARDLFHPQPAITATQCCGDDLTAVKTIDSTLLGYKKSKVAESGFVNLTGLTVTHDGKILVCGNKQVAVFGPDFKTIIVFSTDSVAECIAASGNDIYLGMGSRIAKYDFSGKKVSTWKSLNRRGLITSLSVSGKNLFAADAVNKIILEFSPEGNIIRQIGRKDSASNTPGFILPSPYFDIAFDSFNDLWVANTGRLRIENYSSAGQYQSSWGTSSFSNEGFGGCCNPVHITILPDGKFVTYEKGIDKIKVFDPTGNFLCFVGGAGSFKGNADFQLGNINLVKDIASGVDGSVYVLDAYNQIDVFIKKDL